MNELILFTARRTEFHECPQCAALEKRVDLDSVPGLAVHRLSEHGRPDSEAEAEGWAEADFYDVKSTPTLVCDGELVLDVFEILEKLQRAESPE